MSERLFLIARIAGRTIAIDSDQVESVVDIGAITPVPRASASVRGLAALRSRVVTVIDTSVCLGFPPPETPPGRAVITYGDGHHYAVLVEALEDIAVYPVAPLSGGISIEGGWARAGCGVVDRDGDPVLAIDLRAILPGLALAA
ncbi:chemotaxis protein CheW [Sphingomonas sp.]|uniref:chemotaxis protein CheW n=1 Tax=Sphingomonas sp. TaxID=28214 RepID=UPI001E09529C|nr:CheW domain-containing protein [Sphingomonas sp.]MBX9796357.1 CheW domain-containing protein [Sphingomonas sp.]